MKIDVQLTYDDYREAAAAVRRVQVEKQQRAARWSPGTFAWFLAGVLVVIVAIGLIEGLDPTPGARPPPHGTILRALPGVGIATALLMFNAAQQAASVGTLARRLAVALLPMAAVVALLAGLAWLVYRGALLRGAPPAPYDWYGSLAPHASWLLLFALVTTMTILAQRANLRRMWDGQPNMLRPKAIDVTAGGVTVDEHVSQRQYQWPAFVRWLETPNTLLLCTSDLTFEILPKRCLAGPGDVDAIKGLLAEKIRDPSEPGGFAVVQAPDIRARATPPPLPPRPPGV